MTVMVSSAGFLRKFNKRKVVMNLARVMAVTGMFLILLFSLVTGAIAEQKCKSWAKSILQELKVIQAAYGEDKGECVARGIVNDLKPLSRLGFTFKVPPYHMDIASLGEDRYFITVQAMGDPTDRQEKFIHQKFKSAVKLPVKKEESVPEGKVKYTLGMNYAMMEQLGIASSHEIYGKIRNFVDLMVLDPEKLASRGFPLLVRMDTDHQLSYKGRNRWRLSSRKGDVGPVLVYENWTWSTADAPIAVIPKVKKPKVIVLSPGPMKQLLKEIQIPSGDTMTEEMNLGPVAMLTLSSDTAISEIISYYEKALTSRGWKMKNKMVKKGQGVLAMTKNGGNFAVSTANNKRMQGDATSLYMLTLSQ